jgi:hypothetical protein
MKNTLLICLLGLTMFSNSSFGSDSERTSRRGALGVTGGLSQHGSFSGDIYGGANVPINKINIEVNGGYSYFKNSTDYQGVKDLQFDSHGLFVEGNYFIDRGLYCGIRFALNFNWVDKVSQEKFDNFPDVDSPTFFSGIAGYGHLGYYQLIGKNIGLKLQGQIGLHNYKISEGWLLVNNSDDDIRNEQFGIERHAEVLYSLSVGLVFRL